MKIEDFIKEKIKEKKNDKEICLEILEKYPEITTDTISEKIFNLKKTEAIENELKEKYEKEENEKKMNAEITNCVEEKINEKFKTININEFNQFKNEKKLKRFNTQTKKIEEREVTSDCVAQFNNMLKLLSDGDRINAKAISKEIDQENKYSIKTQVVRSDQDDLGGLAVPTELNDEIMQLEYEKSIMLPYMSRDSVIYQDKIYPLMGDISVDFVDSQKSEILQKNPTFYKSEINMERIGLWTNISNTILRQKGLDLTQAFTSAVASGFSMFLDKQIVEGEKKTGVDAAKNKINGLLHDSNTTKDSSTRTNLTSLKIADLTKIKNQIDVRTNKQSTYWICNNEFADQIGLLKSGDNYIFNGYVEGRQIKPFGVPIIINPQIQGANIIYVDLSKVVIGLSEIRIDESQHFNFTHDVTTFRALRSYGQKVLIDKTNLGPVCIYREYNS